MDLILYGLCFILLQVNMNGLDLLPDFVGYFLMYRGLGQIAPKGSSKISGWCLAMMILTLPLPFVTLLGDAVFVIGIVLALAKLRILIALVMSMKDLAMQLDKDLDTDTLQQRFFLVAAAEAATWVAMLLHVNGLISGLIWLASSVISVLFLMVFHRARLAYRAARL